MLVDILNKQTSKHPLVMVSVRDLVLTSLRHNIVFRAIHVRGVLNRRANLLSRFQLLEFRKAFPEGDLSPTQVPENLLPRMWSLRWRIYYTLHFRWQPVKCTIELGWSLLNSTVIIATHVSNYPFHPHGLHFLSLTYVPNCLAPATINSYLSAISYVRKIQGHTDPCNTFLVEKLRVAIGRRGKSDIRLPISKSLLHQLVNALTHTILSAYQRSLYTSMFMIAFYGFFWISELARKQANQTDRVVSLGTPIHMVFMRWMQADRHRMETIVDIMASCDEEGM